MSEMVKRLGLTHFRVIDPPQGMVEVPGSRGRTGSHKTNWVHYIAPEPAAVLEYLRTETVFQAFLRPENPKPGTPFVLETESPSFWIGRGGEKIKFLSRIWGARIEVRETKKRIIVRHESDGFYKVESVSTARPTAFYLGLTWSHVASALGAKAWAFEEARKDLSRPEDIEPAEWWVRTNAEKLGVQIEDVS